MPPHVSADFLRNVAACTPRDGALIFADVVVLHPVVNEAGAWALGNQGGASISLETFVELSSARAERIEGRETGRYLNMAEHVRALDLTDGWALPGEIPDPPPPPPR